MAKNNKIVDLSQITLDEWAETIKYLIKNNKSLVDSGDKPIAFGIEGSAGLGKTSMIEQIANELNYGYIRLNLAELEEVSDLTGFPIKEYETKDGKWIPADLVHKYCDEDYFTGESRMGYAAPSWLPKKDGEGKDGWILALDDYTRANSLFMQATMELIQNGKYISWNLPKYTTILLSSNPDDGAYAVTSLDPAQRSRFINFPVKFDIDAWARWAENKQLDGRVINFGISYSHELFENENQLKTINPRSYTMFGRAISGIQDWQKSDSLAMILNISKGCFNDPSNVVGNLFTTFVANKLDQLISPKDMLLEKWETVSPKIEKCVYDSSGNYKPAVAAILQTRLLNYAMFYFEQKGSKTEVVYDRLLDILHAKKMLFSEDIVFNIIKTLCTKYAQRTNKWMLNNELRARIIS